MGNTNMKMHSFYMPESLHQELDDLVEEFNEHTKSSLIRECLRIGIKVMKKRAKQEAKE